MKKFCELIGKYFGVVIILFFIGGMTCPPAFTWVLGKLAGFSLLYDSFLSFQFSVKRDRIF